MVCNLARGRAGGKLSPRGSSANEVKASSFAEYPIVSIGGYHRQWYASPLRAIDNVRLPNAILRPPFCRAYAAAAALLPT